MSVYIIAIGGTGAKFAEAVAHLAASGLYARGNQVENLEILFVDPDKGNGNLETADRTLKSYQKCAGVIEEGIDQELHWWMQTEVSLFQGGLWSPFKDQEKFRLRDVFRYDDYSDEKKQKIRHLFDVLYTSQERDQDLREGFRGRPAIGSAIMTQLRQEPTSLESWKMLIDKIAADYHHDNNNPPKVFLCGSIFGGTGASGFPTLGRLLAKALRSESQGDLLGKVKLGGLLMLPYFRFSSFGQAEKETVYTRSEEFILKTEAALRYYGSQDRPFDTVYLLGMPTLTSVETFSTGGKNQRNQPHLLELYAALALRDFIFTDKPKNKEVVLLSRKQANAITWEDLPDKDDSRKKLINAARFAYAWLLIVPDLEHAKQKPRDIFFAPRFYRNQLLRQTSEWDKIQAIQDWSTAYLQWLGTLHQSVGGVNWFNPNAFWDKGNLKIAPEKFPHLVQPGGGVDLTRILTRLDHNGIGGENQGTAGLAKALYRALHQTHI